MTFRLKPQLSALAALDAAASRSRPLQVINRPLLLDSPRHRPLLRMASEPCVARHALSRRHNYTRHAKPRPQCHSPCRPVFKPWFIIWLMYCFWEQMEGFWLPANFSRRTWFCLQVVNSPAVLTCGEAAGLHPAAASQRGRLCPAGRLVDVRVAAWIWNPSRSGVSDETRP